MKRARVQDRWMGDIADRRDFRGDRAGQRRSPGSVRDRHHGTARCRKDARGPLPRSSRRGDGRFHRSNDDLDRLGRRQRKVRRTRSTSWRPCSCSTASEGRRAVSVPVLLELDEPVADAFGVIEPDATVVLVGGNYLLLNEGPWAEAASRLDLSVYVEAPADVRRDYKLARQVRCTAFAQAAALDRDGRRAERRIVERKAARKSAPTTWWCRASCPIAAVVTTCHGTMAACVHRRQVASRACSRRDRRGRVRRRCWRYGSLLRAGGRQPGGDPRPPDNGR